MADSILTLEQLKTRCEDLLDLDSTTSDLNDTTILVGVNDFLAYYQSEEMVRYPSKWRQTTGTLSITSTGYALSLLTNLYGTKRGFKVYRSEVKPQNRLFEVQEDSYREGYYLKDETLFLNLGGNTATPADIIIQYYEKPIRYIVSTQAIDSTVIPIESGAERGVELMVSSRYMERDQSDPQRAVNMRNDSLAEIQSFFKTNTSVVAMPSSPVTF